MEFNIQMWNMMKRRILQTIVVLLAIASNATAQTLSVASVEATTGGQAQLVVSANGITGVTALQFNLALPQGVMLNKSAITKGQAVSGHMLSVQTMDNGDHLIVLYHTDLGLVSSGTLLRLPITAGQQAGSFSGSLYTVRTANTEAVSQMHTDVTFTVTIKSDPVKGDVTGDGFLDSEDVFALVNYILGLGELANETAADVNGDKVVDIADVAALIELIK